MLTSRQPKANGNNTNFKSNQRILLNCLYFNPYPGSNNFVSKIIILPRRSSYFFPTLLSNSFPRCPVCDISIIVHNFSFLDNILVFFCCQCPIIRQFFQSLHYTYVQRSPPAISLLRMIQTVLLYHHVVLFCQISQNV